MEIIHNEQRWIVIATEAYKAREQRKYWEAKEKEQLDQLKELSGNNTMAAGMFIFKKIIQTGRVNYADIPFLKDINLDIYRGKPIEMWKLELRLEEI